MAYLDLGTETQRLYDVLDSCIETWLYSFAFHRTALSLLYLYICIAARMQLFKCQLRCSYLNKEFKDSTLIIILYIITIAYSDGYIKAVWLYDGVNMQGKHIPLLLILVYIPYMYTFSLIIVFSRCLCYPTVMLRVGY